MPLSNGNAFLSEWDAGKYFSKPLCSVRQQFDGHGCGVDNPTKYCLHSIPEYVTLLELFYRDWLVAKCTILEIVMAEVLFYRLEQQLSDAAAVLGSLADGDEVVNEDVYVGG